MNKNLLEETMDKLKDCQNLLDGAVSDALTGDQCSELGVYDATIAISNLMENLTNKFVGK